MTAPLGAAGALSILGDWKLLLFALGTGLMASVIPYLAELAALRRLANNVFSILLSLEPAIAALAGFILLNQHTGFLRWCAIILLVVASMGITITSRRQVAKNSDLLDDAPLAQPVANT